MVLSDQHPHTAYASPLTPVRTAPTFWDTITCNKSCSSVAVVRRVYKTRWFFLQPQRGFFSPINNTTYSTPNNRGSDQAEKWYGSVLTRTAPNRTKPYRPAYSHHDGAAIRCQPAAPTNTCNTTLKTNTKASCLPPRLPLREAGAIYSDSRAAAGSPNPNTLHVQTYHATSAHEPEHTKTGTLTPPPPPPPHKRFSVKCSSLFMRLVEHLTALRAWCMHCLRGR